MPLDAVPAPTIGAASSAAPARAPNAPFEVGQDWSGRYKCPHGETLVIVHVERVEGTHVEGALLFRDPATGESGSYDVSGSYNASTGALALAAGAWIDAARGHPKESLSATVQGRTMTGWVGSPACQLSLEITDAPSSNTPFESND